MDGVPGAMWFVDGLVYIRLSAWVRLFGVCRAAGVAAPTPALPHGGGGRLVVGFPIYIHLSARCVCKWVGVVGESTTGERINSNLPPSGRGSLLVLLARVVALIVVGG